MACAPVVFANPEFGKVRVVEIDGEPWLVGKDVAAVLGYSDTKHAILDHVDSEDRTNSQTQGQNAPEFGQRGTWLINESGLYSLILSSKLPSARKFRRWVTSEVLPSIRKHGGYITGQEQMSDEELSKQASCRQAGRHFYAQIAARVRSIAVSGLRVRPCLLEKITYIKALRYKPLQVA